VFLSFFKPFLYSFMLYTDEVKFGEVVNAPPKIDAKPRRSKPSIAAQTIASGSSTTAIVGLKRQNDLECERETLIQHYRRLKKVKTFREGTRDLTL